MLIGGRFLAFFQSNLIQKIYTYHLEIKGQSIEILNFIDKPNLEPAFGQLPQPEGWEVHDAPDGGCAGGVGGGAGGQAPPRLVAGARRVDVPVEAAHGGHLAHVATSAGVR